MFLLEEEVSFVGVPILIYKFIAHVFVVELACERNWLIVVDASFSVEGVHVPSSLIGEAAVAVVKASFAMHFIVLPLSFVVAVVLKIEDSFSPAFIVLDLSNVFGTYIVLNHFFFIVVLKGFDGSLLFADLFDGGVVALVFRFGLGSGELRLLRE